MLRRIGILIVPCILLALLAACGGPPQYSVVETFGYSQPNVTASISFTITETGKEGPGKVLVTGASLEAARAALVKELQIVLPKGQQGVELYVPIDLHPKEADIPDCVIFQTAGNDQGLLYCHGIPTGARFVFVLGSAMRTDAGVAHQVVYMTVLPYHPAMTSSMGVFTRTRQEAEAYAALAIKKIYATAKSQGLLVPPMYYKSKPFDIPGCSIQKEGIEVGLITCVEQQNA